MANHPFMVAPANAAQLSKNDERPRTENSKHFLLCSLCFLRVLPIHHPNCKVAAMVAHDGGLPQAVFPDRL